MRTPAFSFDEIMAPLGLERFLAEYEGKKPLHLKGQPGKFAEVMNWGKLGDLLSQATIWSQASLQLVLDKQPVPATSYCASAPGRDGGQVMRPDPDKVQEYLRRGATLMLRVDPARALDVEYRARQIVERINAYFGYRAVETLRIVQAPVETVSGKAPALRPSQPAPTVATSPDTDPLTAALARLEQGVHRDRAARRT